VREGGGIRDWIWKGAREQVATLDIVIQYPQGSMPLRHAMQLTETGQRFELWSERVEDEHPCPQGEVVSNVRSYYDWQAAFGLLLVNGQKTQLPPDGVDPEKSILSQRKDPDHYPQITYLGSQYERVRIYREWSFGRGAPIRQPQRADQRMDFLDENCGNLALALNRLGLEPPVKKNLLKWLGELYEGADDFGVNFEGGTAQVFLHEGNFSIPATRLSDGTLRWLCLLAILCHPSPPPLVCIEEPELGLHPDVLPGLAKLLKEASEKTQLIVTTHSEVLVDELTDTPESVVVCEKVDGATRMNRLSKKALGVWLGEYSLGRLWSRGDLGGNRW
jgi:predicted ATPase